MTTHLVRLLAGGSLALVLAACGSGAAPTELDEASVKNDAAATWTRVPTVPLTPRTDPVTAWTGSEVLVVGGNTGWVCPPFADCANPTVLARDGAAYDPATRTWRAIASAPVGLWNSWGGDWDSALAGDVLVVRGTADATWLGYDIAQDAWSTLVPPEGFEGPLAAHDGRLWALSDGRIVSWDPAGDQARLEAAYAPDRPLEDAQIFITPAGPVLAGVRYEDAAPDEPTLTQVDVPDGAGGWRRWATQQIGWLGHYDCSRLIGVEAGEADGGEVNGWDRAYPSAGTLDPLSGDWQPLDVPPRDWSSSAAWDVSAADGTRIVSHGQFIDTRTGRWTFHGRPDSALDHNISTTWAGDQLFLFGGVDDDQGYDHAADPEAWTWTPPG